MRHTLSSRLVYRFFPRVDNQLKTLCNIILQPSEGLLIADFCG